MNKKITAKIIDNAEKNSIIASGSFQDNWKTNIMWTSNIVRWVAVRWYINDFAIYSEYIFSDDSDFYPNRWRWTDDLIATQWSKIPKEFVTEILDISNSDDKDEILKKYR